MGSLKDLNCQSSFKKEYITWKALYYTYMYTCNLHCPDAFTGQFSQTPKEETISTLHNSNIRGKNISPNSFHDVSFTHWYQKWQKTLREMEKKPTDHYLS